MTSRARTRHSQEPRDRRDPPARPSQPRAETDTPDLRRALQRAPEGPAADPSSTAVAHTLRRRAAHRPGDILALQEAVGNRAVGRLLGRSPSAHLGQPLQAKLTVGPVDDPYEREADQVAREVVRRIHEPSPAPRAAPSASRSPDDELTLKAKPALQRRADELGGVEVSPQLEASIECARGGGQPLPASVREPMEQALEADFSGVRVHTGASADRLNRALEARAFTTGRDIFFRGESFQPTSREGQELIAHELTHVVQQSGTAARQRVGPAPEHTAPEPAAAEHQTAQPGLQRSTAAPTRGTAPEIQPLPATAPPVIQRGMLAAASGTLSGGLAGSLYGFFSTGDLTAAALYGISGAITGTLAMLGAAKLGVGTGRATTARATATGTTDIPKSKESATTTAEPMSLKDVKDYCAGVKTLIEEIDQNRAGLEGYIRNQLSFLRTQTFKDEASVTSLDGKGVTQVANLLHQQTGRTVRNTEIEEVKTDLQRIFELMDSVENEMKALNSVLAKKGDTLKILPDNTRVNSYFGKHRKEVTQVEFDDFKEREIDGELRALGNPMHHRQNIDQYMADIDELIDTVLMKYLDILEAMGSSTARRSAASSLSSSDTTTAKSAPLPGPTIKITGTRTPNTDLNSAETQKVQDFFGLNNQNLPLGTPFRTYLKDHLGDIHYERVEGRTSIRISEKHRIVFQEDRTSVPGQVQLNVTHIGDPHYKHG